MLSTLLLGAAITVQLHRFPVPSDGFWSAVTAASDGRIYIGLCKHGGDGHLLVFDPRGGQMRTLGSMPDVTHERNLGRQPQSKIHTKIQEGADGRIYFATHRGNWWFHARAHEPGSYPGGHWLAYDPRTDRFEDMGRFRPELGGIVTLTMDRKRALMYGMTASTGHLLKFDVKTGRGVDLGRLANWDTIVRSLVLDREGRLYGSTDPNRIFRYDPDSDRLEFLPVEIPHREGLEPSPVTSTTTKRMWRVAILSRDEKKIYGIHAGSVDLFEFDPASLKIRKLAQMCPDEYLDSPRVPYATLALAEGLDGILYYAAVGGARRFDYYDTEGASPEGARAHLITYDPATGRRTDHGQLRGPNGEFVLGVEGATTAPDGTIYFVGLVASPKETGIRLLVFNPKEIKK